MNTERLVSPTNSNLPQGMMLLEITKKEPEVLPIMVIRKINLAFEKLFNITSDELNNQPADGVFQKIFGNAFDWNKQFRNSEENHFSFYNNQLDKHFEVDTLKLNQNQIMSVFVDVSMKKRVIRELEEIKAKTEESDRLKIAFLSSISHEIRTPMNAIIGFSKMIGSSDFDDEEKSKFVEIIIQNGQVLLAMINDMISLSQIESNTFVVKKSLCKVNDILATLHKEISYEMDGKDNIRIKVSCESQDPNFSVTTDPCLLKTVLKKLIDNGLKFTESGEVEFGYRILDQNYLGFFVKDTGIGIAEKDLERIFGRFLQLDTRIKRAYEGIGLGLSIVQQAVPLLGGIIQVNSKLGEGSTFTFTLPKV